ncbi:MAG TPA: ChaN family lipoprotein [Nitrospira sp.]|nr:ChaN family lipoprotein [Nitrospira sp.]
MLRQNRMVMMAPAHQTLRSWISAFLLLALGACAGSGVSTSASPESELREGQIIDTATGQPVSVEQLMGRVRGQEVLYLGEEHHNRFHIDAALSLLNRLSAEGRRPVIAMEMFSWDGQPHLDRYVGGSELSRQEFLTQVGWPQNWGGPFENYEPLVAYAKSVHLPLAALNPPKSLVRLVARKGLAQARHDTDWTLWNMQDETIVDDPAYREKILQQLRACHDGGPEELYQTMYEASMVRDEGMARIIVSLIETMRAASNASAGPVVSYTGGGHIQFNLPVPKRVARRLSKDVRQMSVYMTSFEQGRLDDLHEMIAGKIADYLWLTPVGAQGIPRRCR